MSELGDVRRPMKLFPVGTDVVVTFIGGGEYLSGKVARWCYVERRDHHFDALLSTRIRGLEVTADAGLIYIQWHQVQTLRKDERIT